MNCTQAEQLIPLDVGGDLLPSEADPLRQHIDACARCRQLAEEFADSQSWISEFAAPALDPKFDDAAFADLRASVLREIKKTESAEERGRWFGWLLPQRFPRFAVAAALLILIGGGLFSIYSRKTPSRDVANEERSSKPSPISQGGDGTGSVSDLPSTHRAINGTVTPARLSHRNHRLNRHPQAPQPFVPDVSASTAVTAQAVPAVELINDPARATDLAKAEPEMLRIEIQTVDPNIRIIWFAPKTEKTEPNTK